MPEPGWLSLADRDALILTAGPLFLGLPDRWYEEPTWGCPSGHVSRRYLKSDGRGALCLSCHEVVYLLPPPPKATAEPEESR